MGSEASPHLTSDGWRGLIADSFTFDFVERIALAIGQYVLNAGGQQIFIGYDTRFLSREFADRAGRVLKQQGVTALYSSQPIPTPVVSFRVNQKGMICGITITASHNPFTYNGVKVRMGYGGPPDENFTDEIENLMALSCYSLTDKNAELQEDDPLNDYIDKIRGLVDLDIFKTRFLNVLVDTMHGTTTGILRKILLGTKCRVTEIHSNLDPYFGGVAPEPHLSSTVELQRMVMGGQFHLGIAHDGDGDRIIAAIPRIGYLSPHDVASVLLWYLVKIRHESGLVIGSATISRRFSSIAKYFGLDYTEVTTGFRNACKIMRKKKVFIAAEENGGIGFGFYLPERDATVAAALLVEAELNYKDGIKGILREIEKISGKTGLSRLNLKVSIPPKNVVEILKRGCPERLAGQKVIGIGEVDGLKLFLESGDWVNIRAAGTEELVRVCTESNDDRKALRLAKAIEDTIRRVERSQR